MNGIHVVLYGENVSINGNSDFTCFNRAWTVFIPGVKGFIAYGISTLLIENIF